ncbi:WD40 repeat domain-containing protein [Nocardia huaxiensis]|uniref:WD40 repeat domain-containing protein n=1 Tax=Nocardia huaxiensis TaxID=2755382 RepID=A0A7D6ZYX4_9NOCA|nr:WD40 repeat domain-containing protein [Nocardia huaxiensis]QLY31949.1 WD40 repeat domain-containing protein [Nocardia huaxiensis]
MLVGDQPNIEPSSVRETADRQSRSPRGLFAQRFTELYAAAGNPTLRRVATAAETRMRAASGNRPTGASAQRISDWKAGRNVPARFESLLPVVLTLIDLARKQDTPLPRHLAEPKEWQRLWHAATTWNPEEEDEAACPYLGLNSYRRENRDLFFGRTRAAADLTALVREATGIIAVVGASGAGKSSLLAAGLVPALPDWEVVSLTPGPHPLPALLHAATPPDSATPAPAEPETEPGRPRRMLVIDQFEELFTLCADEAEREQVLDLLHVCATRPVDPLAVVIAIRADFYAHCLAHPALQEALEHRSFLLGPMRIDELAQAITGPARSAGLELEPGLEELVVTELCGVGDRPSRTYDPGALPLLSHVMAATWQHREGRRLTIAGYRKAGGVVGSVAETAEQAWNELAPAQQHAAKAILLGLVAVGQDSRDTRRTAPRRELLHRAPDPEDAAAALELLSRTRLITLDADTVGLTHEIVLSAWPRLHGWIDEDRVGYLVRQRLDADASEWAAQDRDSSLLYHGTRLQNALDNVDPPPASPLAREFLTASGLARNRIRRRSSRTRAVLAALGVVLLVLGFATYTQTQLAQQRRDDKNFTTVLAEADRLAATDQSRAAQLYLIAERLRPNDSEVRARILQTQNVPLMQPILGQPADISGVAYRADGVLAAIGFDDALRLWDVQDARHPRQLGTQIDGVRMAGFSADGSRMVTAGYSEDIRLWDVRDPSAPRETARLPGLSAKTMNEPVFVGNDLAVLSTTQFTLWDLSNPSVPVRGPSHRLFDDTRPDESGVVVSRFEASPDGSLLAIISSPGTDVTVKTIQLWDIRNRAAPIKLTERLVADQTAIGDMVFNPSGTLLAISNEVQISRQFIGSRATVELWDVADRAHVSPLGTPLKAEDGDVPALTFSPDGTTLVVSSGSRTALWNVTEPADPVLVTDQLVFDSGSCRYPDNSTYLCSSSASDLGFSPDGRTLYARDSSGKLVVWSLPPSVLTGHSGYLTTPQFDATGDRMVTGSADGRIIVWDISTRQRPTRVGEYRMPADYYSMSLAPDGRTLLVSTARTVKTSVLDLSDPTRIRSRGDWSLPPQDSSPPYPIGDWSSMARIDESGALQIWSLADPMRPVLLTTVPVDPRYSWVSIDIAGQTLIAQQRDLASNGELIVTRWDISNPANPTALGEAFRHHEGVAHFSPDQRVMVITAAEKLQSWDISDPARPQPLADAFAVHTSTTWTVDFTPDGRTMLTASVDGAPQLWDYTDPADPRRMGGPLMDVGKEPWDARFHPDGRFVVGNGSNGALRFWDLDEQHMIDRICTATGNPWTPELWRRYLPDLDYDPPCD